MFGLFLNLTGVVAELGATVLGTTYLLGATLVSLLSGLTSGLGSLG